MLRPSTRHLAAAVKRLEPGAPTGLTGLATHSAPRSSLIFLYTSTLRKLQALPPHSIYRQATESLTKQRLGVIEAIKPEGYHTWLEKVQYQIHNRGEDYAKKFGLESEGEKVGAFAYTKFKTPLGEVATAGELAGELPEGLRNVTESTVAIDPEPQYSVEQVREIEEKIDGGLLEEVIQVAEGEWRLVDEMVKSKVWEPLVEAAPEGQWAYFERKTSSVTTGAHTATQKPA